MLDRLLGDPEGKPLVPSGEFVPDVDLDPDDDLAPDEGDADGQDKARRKRAKQ